MPHPRRPAHSGGNRFTFLEIGDLSRKQIRGEALKEGPVAKPGLSLDVAGSEKAGTQRCRDQRRRDPLS